MLVQKIFIVAAIVACCSADYIDDGLSNHNTYRSTHHADNLQLDSTLNDKAAQCAQYYANKGTIDHSCPYKGQVGENLGWAWSSAGSPSLSTASKKAVDAWYNEVQWYNYEDPANSSVPSGQAIGHFTQLVWKASTSVGIAAYQNTTAKSTFTVALYSPQGNMLWGGSGDRYQFYKQNVLKP